MFHEYVRPVHYPTLTTFCTALTGIEQPTVDNADTFPDVWTRYLAWLAHVIKALGDDSSSFAFLTCGAWDLKTCLPTQLSNAGLASQKLPDLLRAKRVINVKNEFRKHYALKKAKGMDGMLKYLKEPLVV